MLPLLRSFGDISTKILAGGVFFPAKEVHTIDLFALPTSMDRIAILLINLFLSLAFLFALACKRKHFEVFGFASLPHKPILCPLVPLVLRLSSKPPCLLLFPSKRPDTLVGTLRRSIGTQCAARMIRSLILVRFLARPRFRMHVHTLWYLWLLSTDARFEYASCRARSMHLPSCGQPGNGANRVRGNLRASLGSH